MKQLSFRKLSLLGLVLIAASAVTAAMIPKASSSDAQKFVGNGSIRNSDGGVGSPTCSSNAADTTPDCFDTNSAGGNSVSSDGDVTSFDTQTAGGHIDNGNTTEGDNV